MRAFIHRYRCKNGFSVIVLKRSTLLNRLVADSLLPKTHRFIDSLCAGAMCPVAFWSVILKRMKRLSTRDRAQAKGIAATPLTPPKERRLRP